MERVVYLTPDELAERWQVKTGMLAQQRWLGEGPEYTKFGRLVRYGLRAVIDYEQTQTVRPGAV